MYQLLVFFPGKRGPHATVRVQRASEVLEMIPKLLGDHGGCERVVVMVDHVRLFAVDCKGNRLE
jgi:hypothetical protein